MRAGYRIFFLMHLYVFWYVSPSLTCTFQWEHVHALIFLGMVPHFSMVVFASRKASPNCVSTASFWPRPSGCRTPSNSSGRRPGSHVRIQQIHHVARHRSRCRGPRWTWTALKRPYPCALGWFRRGSRVHEFMSCWNFLQLQGQKLTLKKKVETTHFHMQKGSKGLHVLLWFVHVSTPRREFIYLPLKSHFHINPIELDLSIDAIYYYIAHWFNICIYTYRIYCVT